MRIARASSVLLGLVFLLVSAAPRDAVGGSSLGARESMATLAERHLRASRARTLEACRERGIELPPDFIAWIDGDPTVRRTVWGCRADPLPVLLGLRALELDLGKDLVRREYTNLALAFAMQGSYVEWREDAGPWNDGDVDRPPATLPEVTARTPIELVVPGDPRVPATMPPPGPDSTVHELVIAFLEGHAPIEVEMIVEEPPPLEYDERGIAKPTAPSSRVMRKVVRPLVGADVIASRALQQEFNAFMAAHGRAEIVLDCGDGVVSWMSTAAVADPALRERIRRAHELFHEAYKATGRMPTSRDRAPTPAESMAWFIRNDRHRFDPAVQADRAWPRFPLDAPWPALMMLAADDQPLREREEIWLRFRDRGELRTYGEYIGDIAQQFDMQSARRVSPLPFSYGSIQMMWKDGGVCGTMGNIGARTHRIVGQPASTAGQPGHCAIVVWEQDPATKALRCVGGQYATGGDEVTVVHAGWNYDDRGGRRPMLFHQSVAHALNEDASGFLDALVMLRAFQALSEAARGRLAVDLVDQGLAANPFAIALVEAALASATTGLDAAAILDAAEERIDADELARRWSLYRVTIRELAHARVLALPPPKGAIGARRLLERLEAQQCTNARLLARCWRGIGGEAEFDRRTEEAIARHVASAEAGGDRRDDAGLAEQVRSWSGTLPDDASRAAWSRRVLGSLPKERVASLRAATPPDPAIAELDRLAGLDAGG